MFHLVNIFFLLAIVTILFTSPTGATLCQFEEKGIFFNYTATCHTDQLIPDHFPPNLTTLFLGISNGSENNGYLNYSNCSGSGQISFLPADKMPISGITDLKRVLFCNFNFNDGRAKKISPYLKNVQSTLETLLIQYGKLARLNAGILPGLTNLKELEISDAGLEHIEPGAFHEITLSGPALITGYLSLSGNRLKTFDWSVLQPMVLGLQDLRLKGNAMESMQISRPFSFQNLATIDLSTNNLRTIPVAVLKSWPRNLWKLNTLGNQFCPTDGLCRCCSVQLLWEYVTKNGINLAMTCGPAYKEEEDCPIGGNATTSKRKSACSADCNIVTMEMVDLAQYESCAANADSHGMACDMNGPANDRNGRPKKQRERAKRVAWLS